MNENNFNKSYDTSTTGTYTNISYNYTDGCLYRLPCGYCKILEKACPMHYNFNYNQICDPPHNLNQVTCEVKQ
jgi:hypothetical protein